MVVALCSPTQRADLVIPPSDREVATSLINEYIRRADGRPFQEDQAIIVIGRSLDDKKLTENLANLKQRGEIHPIDLGLMESSPIALSIPGASDKVSRVQAIIFLDREGGLKIRNIG